MEMAILCFTPDHLLSTGQYVLSFFFPSVVKMAKGNYANTDHWGITPDRVVRPSSGDISPRRLSCLPVGWFCDPPRVPVSILNHEYSFYESLLLSMSFLRGETVPCSFLYPKHITQGLAWRKHLVNKCLHSE